MRVIVLGETGKIGHIVSLYLKKTGIKVYTTSRYLNSNYYFNPTRNLNDMEKIIENLKPDAIINAMGINERNVNNNYKEALLVNYYLPIYLNLLSKKYSFKYIHLSPTEIFDNNKEYTERDLPNSCTLYGKTKAIENLIDEKNLIIRTKILPISSKSCNLDFLNEWSKETSQIAEKNNWIRGVTTLELAKCLKGCLILDLKGIHHVFNNEAITEYEWLCKVRKLFNLKTRIISSDKLNIYPNLIKTNYSYPLPILKYDDMLDDMYLWVVTSTFAYPETRWIKRYSQDENLVYRKV